MVTLMTSAYLKTFANSKVLDFFGTMLLPREQDIADIMSL